MLPEIGGGKRGALRSHYCRSLTGEGRGGGEGKAWTSILYGISLRGGGPRKRDEHPLTLWGGEGGGSQLLINYRCAKKGGSRKKKKRMVLTLRGGGGGSARDY